MTIKEFGRDTHVPIAVYEEVDREIDNKTDKAWAFVILVFATGYVATSLVLLPLFSELVYTLPLDNERWFETYIIMPPIFLAILSVITWFDAEMESAVILSSKAQNIFDGVCEGVGVWKTLPTFGKIIFAISISLICLSIFVHLGLIMLIPFIFN